MLMLRQVLSRSPAIVLAVWMVSACQPTQAIPDGNAPIAETPEPRPFAIETLITDLEHPWGLAQLSPNELLVTERGGQLLLFVRDENGKFGAAKKIAGIPEVRHKGQGGLLDVAMDPDFAANAYIYLSWSAEAENGEGGTALGRGQLRGLALEGFTTLFELPIKTGKNHHFGSRIAFDDNGHVYLSIGDRGERDRAQNPSDPAGSILRLHRDGSVPEDNPFFDSTNVHPAIYSFGHRNPQGLAWDAASATLVSHEHGPQGGDEVNRIVGGANFGWPRITYGREYVTGLAIGEGTQADDVIHPDHVWIPSIAPSGLTVVSGSAFSDWEDDLLLGSLKNQMLVRLERDGAHIVAEHRYPLPEHGRIRDVRMALDGAIYLLTDASRGSLLRLTPLP